jgi:hypothetical protein
VTAVVVSGESRTTVFRQVLDSGNKDASPSPVFDVTFEVKSDAALWLSCTDLGPQSACAWVSWKRVILE